MITSVLIVDESERDLLAGLQTGPVDFPGRKSGNLPIIYDEVLGEYILNLGHRVELVPESLRDLKIKGFAVIKKDAYPTKAYDGYFYEQKGRAMTIAYVETSVGSGGPYQYLQVVSDIRDPRAAFGPLYDWMIDLMNGKKNHKCHNPVIHDTFATLPPAGMRPIGGDDGAND